MKEFQLTDEEREMNYHDFVEQIAQLTEEEKLLPAELVWDLGRGFERFMSDAEHCGIEYSIKICHTNIERCEKFLRKTCPRMWGREEDTFIFCQIFSDE